MQLKSEFAGGKRDALSCCLAWFVVSPSQANSRDLASHQGNANSVLCVLPR